MAMGVRTEEEGGEGGEAQKCSGSGDTYGEKKMAEVGIFDQERIDLHRQICS